MTFLTNYSVLVYPFEFITQNASDYIDGIGNFSLSAFVLLFLDFRFYYCLLFCIIIFLSFRFNNVYVLRFVICNITLKTTMIELRIQFKNVNF